MPGKKKKTDSAEEAFVKSVAEVTAASKESFEEKEHTTEYGVLFDKHKHKHEDAVFEYCFLHNLFFDSSLIQ